MAVPSDFTGLILWLPADAITGLSDGDPIAVWEDQSGLGNDAFEATVGEQPYYRTNRLNGLPIVDFTVPGSIILDIPINLLHPYTIFYVAQQDPGTGAANHRIIQSTSTNWLMGPYGGFWQWYTGTGFAPAGPVAPNTGWIIHSVRADTPSGTHFVWDLETATAPFSGTYASPLAVGQLNLGNLGTAYEPANSEIAEVIIYNVELSDADRDAVVDYLRVKWGGLAPPVPNTVTVTGDVATVAGDGTVTITGPSGVVYTGGAGSTGPLDPGAYTWTSTDGGSGGFSISAGGGNRMGGTGAVRKPPR